MESVLWMVSSVASGLFLVGTLTSCFRLGERLSMDFRFSLLLSPAIINCNPGPYFAQRVLNVSDIWWTKSALVVLFV